MLPDRVMVSLVVPVGETAVAEEEDMTMVVDTVVEEEEVRLTLVERLLCAHDMSLFYLGSDFSLLLPHLYLTSRIDTLGYDNGGGGGGRW